MTVATTETGDTSNSLKYLSLIAAGAIAGAAGMWAYLESNALLPGPLSRNTMTSYLSCMSGFSSGTLNSVDQLQASQICTNRHQRKLLDMVGRLRGSFDADENRIVIWQEDTSVKLVTSITGTLAVVSSPEGDFESEYPFRASRTAAASALPVSFEGTFETDLLADVDDLPWCSDETTEGRSKTWWSDEIVGLVLR